MGWNHLSFIGNISHDREILEVDYPDGLMIITLKNKQLTIYTKSNGWSSIFLVCLATTKVSIYRKIIV